MNGQGLVPAASGPIVLSNAAIEDFTRCPSYYLYRRVFNVVRVTERAGPAQFGRAFHAADEAYAKGLLPLDCVRVALDMYIPTYDGSDEIRTPAKLQLLLEEYFKFYSFDQARYECCGSEVWFEEKMTDQITYRGFIDKILRERSTGKIWLKDIKTTSRPAAFVSEPNSQFTGYIWAAKSKWPAQDIAGLIVDVIAVQKTKPVPRKDGKGWLAGAGPADVFHRYPTYRTDDQLNEWHNELKTTCYMIQSCHQLGIWPKWQSCMEYNSECPYRPLCNQPTESRGAMLSSSMYKAIEYDTTRQRNEVTL